jgi:hypothetical protein
MNPIIPLLIFGAGWLFGNKSGKASAQERINELQTLMLRVHAVNEQREAEMAQLRAYIDNLNEELGSILSQQGAVAEFGHWLSDQHPEIVQRYQAIQHAEASVSALELEVSANRQKLAQTYTRTKREFPREVAEFESRVGSPT